MTVKAGDVSKEVKVTVKADKKANITGNYNTYLKDLVKSKTDVGSLEWQRDQGLN